MQQLAAAPVTQPGFQETSALAGLTQPTAVRFAPDGSVFVAEKRGVVKRFSDLDDLTPDVVVDRQTFTHDYWDRGMLGLAIDPGYPARPYVYVSYTYDHVLGSTTPPPRWGDTCPTPPGATIQGCAVSGRISRFDLAGHETVLVEDFCQQFPSHSIGGLAFGADGALYASAGDGASFDFADRGQNIPPCADPAGEGGSLRSQDLRTRDDPTGLDGSILRLNPDTGAAAAGNPLAGDAEPNAQRIIAQGLRNPFRIAVRPGTSELWAGDVGWRRWEEIDRIADARSGVTNFGWPCYEGAGRMPTWDTLNAPICEELYGQAGAVAAPYYTYDHNAHVVAGETCPTGGSSISGLAFYNGGTFPPEYDGALFLADYSRRCIWAIMPGPDGLPDPAQRRVFVADAEAPIDLQVGPGGDLYYVDLEGGTVRRIHATAGNGVPTAVARASVDHGPLPLSVRFSAAGSSDPDDDALSYAWDLDGDGAFDDGTGVDASRTFTSSGQHSVRLRVRDPSGLSATTQLTIYAGVPPTAVIGAPAAGTRWQVGDLLAYSGSGWDGSGSPLPPAALEWSLDLHHCDDQGGCHVHHVQSLGAGTSGSFTAPDHEFPSYLALVLRARDAGLSTVVSRRLDPRTVRLTVATDPAGLDVTEGFSSGPAPLVREVIVGSRNTIGTTSPQLSQGRSWVFTGWSDGGMPAHEVIAPGTDATYAAAFSAGAPVVPPASPRPARRGPVAAWGFEERAGTEAKDATGHGRTGHIRHARRVRRGHYGAGLALDGGGDSVTLPALALPKAFTVEAWVLPERRRGRVPVATGERSHGTAFALNGDHARRWRHVALTWDGRVLRRYVSGRRVGRSRSAPTVTRGLRRLRFGADRPAGAWLDGRLDEVRVYDRALNAAEIAGDMARPVG